MRSHRHLRIARITAATASTASHGRNRHKAGCEKKSDRQGGAAHTRSIRLSRREFKIIRSVGAALESTRGELAEVAAHRAVTGRGAGDLVLGAAEFEVSVPGRPGCPHVAVERHPDTPWIDQVRVIRAGTAE